jgi:hypothetical protein
MFLPADSPWKLPWAAGVAGPAEAAAGPVVAAASQAEVAAGPVVAAAGHNDPLTSEQAHR